jgi:hypothetical protein
MKITATPQLKFDPTQEKRFSESSNARVGTDMDDPRIEWPWSLEEEIQWKSELAKRDADLEGADADLDEAPAQVIDIREEEAEGFPANKYLVTA